MPKSSRLLAAILGCVLSGAALAAEKAAPADASQAKVDALLDAIRANRRALVAVNLDLGAEDAAKFWPLYDRYQEEMKPLGDRIAEIVGEYTANFRELSDENARRLMEGYLSAEAGRLAVRRAYLDEFAKILPGRTVARFYQIENKMDAILRYDLAREIPVMDEKGPAPAK